jgi:hypothetical protein
MEPDSEYARCYPPQPAFTRLGEIFPVGFARNGADPAIGRRVPELSGQAGLTDIGTEARVQMYLPADDPTRPGAQHAPVGAEAGTGQPGPAC